jgi:glucosamine 6-phosphate synthetase-like amidotransferase/phosphosugar isomerase protein
MCGLVGVAGKLAYKDEGLIRRLLLLDWIRGPDSTGLAAIRKADGEAHIAKIASHPIDLFDTKRFGTTLSGHSSSVFLGHNRAATKGKVNEVNAHPFHYDHIVGAHNGTLSHSSFSALETALGEKFSVDSQAIFAGIARLGLKETMKLLEGAWALVWYDQQQGTLNFVKNNLRPLWYAYTSTFDRLIWASEFEFIRGAVNMGAYDEKLDEDTEGRKYRGMADDTHYVFDVEALAAGGKKYKPKCTPMKGKEVVVSATKHDPFSRVTGVANTSNTGNRPTTGNSGTKTSHSDKSEKKEVILHLIGNPCDPYSGFITQERFEELAIAGCAFCPAPVDFTDIGVTIYEKDGVVLCPNCSRPEKGRPANRIYVPNIQSHMVNTDA